ncbi:hypothetical protein CG402_00675 [Bifidobacteriaceae bacterium NR020]|nr:hypothetical protein CG402_00675 [Bifidobacteriaceae bacterium NR020]
MSTFITFYNVLHCYTILYKRFTLYYDCITFVVHVYVYCANYIKFKVFDVRVKNFVAIADCVLRE